MSLNAAKERRGSIKVDASRNILGRLSSGLGFAQRNILAARTEEERAAAEAEAISVLESLVNSTLSMPAVKETELSYIDQKGLINTISHLSGYGYNKVAALVLLYLDYYNSYQSSLLNLTGLIRRVNQKKAVLNMWDGAAKYIVAEKFNNLDLIDSTFTSAPLLDINPVQGVATLPVKQQTKISAAAVVIGRRSNGVPGNSDVGVSHLTADPRNLLKPNGLCFEYERLDSGPCELELVFQFDKEEVVNQIEIGLTEGSSAPFDIVDAIFIKSSGRGYRLSQMLASDTPDDFFSVKNVSSGGKWKVTFLPVPAKTVTLIFRQTNSSVISAASVNLGTSNRHRYAISLSEINFYRNEYMQQGGINSKEIALLGSLYAVTGQVSVYPKTKTFYDLSLGFSGDGGQTWSLLGSDTTLMDGTEDSCIWKLLVQNTEPFKLETVFQDNRIYNVQSLSRTVSNRVSPVSFRLPEKPDSNSAFAMYKLAHCSDDIHKAQFLATGKAIESLIPLPFDIDEIGIKTNELHVYVNRREWTEIVDPAALALGNYMFSADHRSLIFSKDLPDKGSVSIAIAEERCLFINRSDGYYLYPKNLFDPESCLLTHTPSTFKHRSKVLPRGLTRVVLDHTEIDPGSFTIVSTNGTVYNSVASRAALAAAGDYYLDPINGILYLFQAIATDIPRCSFRYASRTSLGNDSYNVIYEELVPSAICIKKDALAVHEITDTVGWGLAGRINLTTGEYAARTDLVPGAARAMTLSYDYIIKDSMICGSDLMGYTGSANKPTEVEFIDGYTEFLGLISVESEETVAIISGGISHFTLAAGALWYSPMDVVFSDTTVFVTPRTSYAGIVNFGDYYIDPSTGDVYVMNDIPAGIRMTYYYRDIEWAASNRFSVDYENGILYTSEDMVQGAEIKYKAASYKLAYNLCKQIDSKYNSSSQSVQINTEALAQSSPVKVFWRKEEERENVELSNYFSPIISSLKFRFE